MEFSDVTSSLFLFWLLVARGLGGGDVPLEVITAGDGGEDSPLAATREMSAVTLLVLTSTAETWLEESTRSSSPASLPLDNGSCSSVCMGSDWLGLSLGEGISDREIWYLLSSDRGLSPLVTGSSPSSLTLLDSSSVWSSFWASSPACSASLLLSSSFSSSSMDIRKVKQWNCYSLSPPSCSANSHFIIEL